MFIRTLVLILCLCLISQTLAQDPLSKLNGPTAMARSMAWFNYQYMNSRLGKIEPQAYPGIRNWLDEYKTFGKDARPDDPTSWPKEFDFNKVVFSNPKFWQATFEVIPGDGAWMSYYTGTLIGSGEFRRGADATILLLHRDHVKEDMRKVMLQSMTMGYRAIDECGELVNGGIKLYDEGKYDEALAKHKQAIEMNPANGQAWYEYGYTLRKKEIGDVPPNQPAAKFEYKDGKLVGDLPKHFTPEVRTAYEKSRQHNPLFPPAYFIDDKATFERGLAINEKILPLWEEFTKDGPEGHVTDETLVKFAGLCQENGLHEMAILSRIVLAERHKHYAPEDIDFLEKSLKVIAPGQPVDDAMKRLRSADPNLRMLFPQKQ